MSNYFYVNSFRIEEAGGERMVYVDFSQSRGGPPDLEGLRHDGDVQLVMRYETVTELRDALAGVAGAGA